MSELHPLCFLWMSLLIIAINSVLVLVDICLEKNIGIELVLGASFKHDPLSTLYGIGIAQD